MRCVVQTVASIRGGGAGIAAAAVVTRVDERHEWVGAQTRADWLSHAEIVTRVDPAAPSWASPLRRFLKYDAIPLAVPGYDTQPRGRADSGGDGGGGARSAGAATAAGAFDEDWSRTMALSDLFFEAQDLLPVSIRRFGPVVTSVPPTPGSAAPGDIDYFGPTAHGASAPPISALAGARAACVRTRVACVRDVSVGVCVWVCVRAMRFFLHLRARIWTPSEARVCAL
jgi:hypothetical protein